MGLSDKTPSSSLCHFRYLEAESIYLAFRLKHVNLIIDMAVTLIEKNEPIVLEFVNILQQI